MNLAKSIILIGIKHSGKSTQGRALSARLNCEFFDTDDVILNLTKKTPREIFNNEGYESFLAAEQLACQHLQSVLKIKPSIVATGGGICENKKAISFLVANSIFVYLCVEEKTAIERIICEVKNDGNRILDLSSLPSFIARKNPTTIDEVRNLFHNFYEERSKKYSKLAEITIYSEKKSAKAITDEIISKL